MGNKSGNCYNSEANDDKYELMNKKYEVNTPIYIESEMNLEVLVEPEEVKEEKMEPMAFAKKITEVRQYTQEPSDFTPAIAGNFIQGKLNGKGTMTYPNGCIYEGINFIDKSMFH